MKRLYHFTNKKNLESISKNGLVPSNGENSKAISDEDKVVCYSEGYEGAIAINMSFEEQFKRKKDNNEHGFKGDTLKEHLGDNVYLSFDGENIENQSINNVNGFFNGKTSQKIEPQKLSVCVLKDKDGNTITEREKIVYYMMSKTPIENYSKLEMCKKEDYKKDFMKRINDYYNKNQENIKKYSSKEYSMEEISLEKYMELDKNKDDINDDRANFLSNLKDKVNTEISQRDLEDDNDTKNIEKEKQIQEKKTL